MGDVPPVTAFSPPRQPLRPDLRNVVGPGRQYLGMGGTPGRTKSSDMLRTPTAITPCEATSPTTNNRRGLWS